jgi:UTP--glucose-1-phosphate uridylyltransferase
MSAAVRKAVFPVGGLGTRFLPATKAMPKEMLPVVDKPLIQYAVEEAMAAGIESFIFVTGRGKTAIEDHFDLSWELSATLVERDKTRELEAIGEMVMKPGQVAYVRQQEPKGLGHAVWCARQLVGNEPFAVLLADDLIKAEEPCLAQMARAYDEVGGNLLAVMDVPREHTSRYGVLDVAAESGRLAQVRGLVEKPPPESAPSTLAIIGRYILDPSIFGELSGHRVGAGGEVQLTDAIAATIGRVPCHGFRFSGRRFDCGSKAGFIEANITYALDHPEIGSEVRAALSDLTLGEP